MGFLVLVLIPFLFNIISTHPELLSQFWGIKNIINPPFTLSLSLFLYVCVFKCRKHIESRGQHKFSSLIAVQVDFRGRVSHCIEYSWTDKLALEICLTLLTTLPSSPAQVTDAYDHSLLLYMHARYLNSGPDAFLGGTLPTEPSPQNNV